VTGAILAPPLWGAWREAGEVSEKEACHRENFVNHNNIVKYAVQA